MSRSISAIKDAATANLRRYLSAPEDDRTELLRAVAADFVDLREQYITPEGEPDWGGKSYAYRQIVGEIYSDAGVQRGDRSSVRAAIGYHVGNVLRERLSPEELDDLGFRTLSPRDRSVEKREKQNAVLGMFRTGPAPSTVDEAMHAFTAAKALLARVPDEAVVGARAEERRAVVELLSEVSDEAARLTAAARRRGRRKGSE
jgi:hypothetical protein